MGRVSGMRGVLYEGVGVIIGEKGDGRVWLWRDMYVIIMLEEKGDLHVLNGLVEFRNLYTVYFLATC